MQLGMHYASEELWRRPPYNRGSVHASFGEKGGIRKAVVNLYQNANNPLCLAHHQPEFSFFWLYVRFYASHYYGLVH